MDMVQLRRRRDRQIKAAQYLLEDVEEIAKTNDAETTSLTILSEKGNALNLLLQKGNQLMDILRHEEDDSDQIAMDKAQRNAFFAITNKVSNICQEMGAVKRLTRTSKAIQRALDNLEGLTRAEPAKDYTDCFTDINFQMAVLTSGLFDSTIHAGHDLWREKEEYTNRIMGLKAEKKTAPASVTVMKPEFDREFTMPKLTIPKFKGALESWQGFWNRFKAAVHDNPRLKDSVKMALLIDLVADPHLVDYMTAANDGKEGRYQEVIKYMQSRFDQPRELHNINCRKLSEMGPIKPTSSELAQAADIIFSAVEGIKRSGQDTIEHLATSLVIHHLPKQLRQEWETKAEEDPKVPTVTQFITFLRKKSLHAAKGALSPPSSGVSRPAREGKKEKATLNHSQGKVYVATSQPPPETDSQPHRSKNPSKLPAVNTCKVTYQLCSSMHYVFQCSKFMDMTVAQRKSHVQSSSLCTNCLRPGHGLQDCQCSYKCRICKGHHNTLLHTDSTSSSGAVLTVTNSSKRPLSTEQRKEKLLMTSQVVLTGPTGKQMVVRALLDSGAEVSIISSKIMNQLQLTKQDEWMTLQGIESPENSTARPTAMVTVSGVNNREWSQPVKVTVLPKVCTQLPKEHLQSIRDMPHLRDLELADPHFYEPRRVDIILDVDFTDSVTLPEKVVGPPGTPSAWRTELGWVVVGRYFTSDVYQPPTASLHFTTEEAEDYKSDKLLERFWKMEELIRGPPLMSHRESEVQQHFMDTHYFSPAEGRYVVSLPKRQTTLQLGESRQTALSRFIRNEKTLIKKGTWESFQEVVREYVTLGHAQPVTQEEMLTPVQKHYYLPMHAVFKASSSSTKIRVVFDASCKTTTDVSLNDLLEAGPTLHPNLDQILIRFRQYKVALSGDIGKMYREVILSQPDRQLHRFLWRETTDQPISSFCMNRVTFGVTSSPYVAVRALQQTAADFSTPSARASQHIHNSFYVDDLLAGAESSAEAIGLYTELREVLAKGGFDLKKWRSSSAEVLKAIPTELQELIPRQELVDSHTAQYPKTLGITWDSRLDQMAVQVQLPKDYCSTKRGIVSDTAWSYDVLGWVAPVIVKMKILYQSLWKKKLEWDQIPDDETVRLHSEWRQQLPVLSSVTLPRCYFSAGKVTTTQLHGFCDASVQAYAAVIYLRATYEDGTVTSRLVVAKTKVAPLSTVSIPRLELCGAVLLAELLEVTGNTLNIPKHFQSAWCDSTVALAWLRGCPSRYKVFVGNRIAAAARSLPPSAWRHVPTLHNPADCASRGVTAQELKDHDLWWGGPPWLTQEPMEIPPQPQSSDLAERGGEEAKPVQVLSISVSPLKWWELEFKDYVKLLHTTSFVLRFVSNLKAATQKQPLNKQKALAVTEVEEAERFLFRRSQARTYGAELARLKSNPTTPMSKSSSLRLVHPFLSKEGLLQVGGRLNQAELSPLQRHPVILSTSDGITKLLFVHFHRKLSHCGPTLLLANTGLTIYSPGAKRLARSVCQGCILCRKAFPRTLQQKMGQLPSPRVNPALAFIHCGVDYAGPFLLKRGNPRKPTMTKGYLAVFVCLTTKPIHLEVVSSASTEAFIATLKRFVARRGQPRHLYSDHGSNFIGARNELAELYHVLSLPTTDQAVQQCLLQRQITWHHIPEKAPHFGGLWESSVKSAKHCIKKTVGSTKLNFEELTTIACQIEGHLNSRPYLAQDSHDPEGEMPLTRGHFLIGRPLESYPEEPQEPDLSLTKRWDLCKSIVQKFWNMWSSQYLQSLQKATKWHAETPNLKAGDLVMLLEDSELQSHWRMARVTQTFPGKDGLTRTAEVTVKTPVFPEYYAKTKRQLDLKDLKVKSSTFRRPIHKLAPLMAASPLNIL